MRICLYSDPHFITNSSIVVGKMDNQEHERYSARLDRCISTIKWINKVSESQKCDKIICLGDLVEDHRLSAEELSAISEAGIQNHIMLIGNHDISSADGYFNSVNLYGNAIREAKRESFVKDGFNIIWLPYAKDLVNLNELCQGLNRERTLILSHNDIKGIFYKNWQSIHGYELKDILNNCRLFINGHLHTGEWVHQDRILNLGTCTGLNFNHANCWGHKVAIFDSDSWSLELLDNPYALNFVDQRVVSRLQLINFFNNLNREITYVAQLRVPKSLVEVTRHMISDTPNIAFDRILTLHETSPSDDSEDNRPDSPTETIQSELNVFDSLREFVKLNCDERKYDKASVLCEINNLEEMSK